MPLAHGKCKAPRFLTRSDSLASLNHLAAASGEPLAICYPHASPAGQERRRALRSLNTIHQQRVLSSRNATKTFEYLSKLIRRYMRSHSLHCYSVAKRPPKEMNSSTFFTLMAEYGTGDIPLDKCCEKYFGMSLKKASAQARHQQLPIPAYRGGSQKSMWLISAVDLANHIDTLKEKAKHDWQRINP